LQTPHRGEVDESSLDRPVSRGRKIPVVSLKKRAELEGLIIPNLQINGILAECHPGTWAKTQQLQDVS
jgi:hypothetical protein